MALSTLNYLHIDRVDQAEKQVKAMAAVDEDATVTQLAMAWTDLYLVSCGACQWLSGVVVC
jgi:coatomer subunit epsilon